MRKTLLAAAVITALSLNATDYYVSPSGNDNNNGSVEAPFLTLKKAIESRYIFEKAPTNRYRAR